MLKRKEQSSYDNNSLTFYGIIIEKDRFERFWEKCKYGPFTAYLNDNRSAMQLPRIYARLNVSRGALQ